MAVLILVFILFMVEFVFGYTSLNPHLEWPGRKVRNFGGIPLDRMDMFLVFLIFPTTLSIRRKVLFSHSHYGWNCI